MPEREFFRALDVLLDTGAYTAARPYFQLGARNAARHAPEWQEAQVWVAYRAGDRAPALEVTGRQPGAFPAFEAFVAAWKRGRATPGHRP